MNQSPVVIGRFGITGFAAFGCVYPDIAHADSLTIQQNINGIAINDVHDDSRLSAWR